MSVFKKMYEEGWCDGCMIDTSFCSDSDCCPCAMAFELCQEQSSITNLEWLTGNPMDLAALLVTPSMAFEAIHFISPAGTFEDRQDAINATVKWLNNPHED